MNISLTPDLDQMVADHIASGRYASATDVVRDALRLLRERDETQRQRVDQLRRDIDVGLEQLDRDEVVDGEQVFAELRQMSIARGGSAK